MNLTLNKLFMLEESPFSDIFYTDATFRFSKIKDHQLLLGAHQYFSKWLQNQYQFTIQQKGQISDLLHVPLIITRQFSIQIFHEVYWWIYREQTRNLNFNIRFELHQQRRQLPGSGINWHLPLSRTKWYQHQNLKQYRRLLSIFQNQW